MIGDKLHPLERNNPDHQLRPLDDCLIINEVGCEDNHEAKRSVETIRCKNELIREHSTLEERIRANSGR
ncbi:hypothetical protein CR513_47838, partial [Mucuna pruriens]